MKTIDPEATVRPMRLVPGQALHIPVRPRTGVQVLAGSLRLREPARWLSETAVSPLHRIDEGQWLQLEDGGWVQMEALDGEVQLLLVEPAEALAWLWRRVRALLRGAARRPPASAPDAQGFCWSLAITAARRSRLSFGHISEAL